MLAIPTLELQNKHCVQGDVAAQGPDPRCFDDPVDVARRWAAIGFSRLHVVDLDATAGRGDNRSRVAEVVAKVPVLLHVSSGEVSQDTIDGLITDGIARIVLAAHGARDVQALAEQASYLPGQTILAIDVRDGHVVMRNGSPRSRVRVGDFLAEIDDLPLAGLFVAAPQKEFRAPSMDLSVIEDLVRESPWPVSIAAGHGASLQSLRNLEDRGVWAAVLGTALTSDTLDLRVAAEEFST